MREVIDDLYLFSLSSEGFGNIIAQRTRTAESAEGENVFSHLLIDRDEMMFLNQTDFSDNKSPRIAVCGRGGEDHCVIVDTFSSHEIPVGIAMEIPRQCRAIRAAYDGRERMISPSAQKLIEKYKSADHDPETEIAVSKSVATFLEIAHTANADGDVSCS